MCLTHSHTMTLTSKISRDHLPNKFEKKKKSISNPCLCWLVVLGFNATLTAKVISGRSVTHMCFLAFSHQYQHNFFFQSHRLLFSHASAEVRGENSPERKAASTGDRTPNHQVMSPTCSPPSHPGGAPALVSYGQGAHWMNP